MKRLTTLCALLLSAGPAFAAPKCETELARIETADKRVFTVERYGTARWADPPTGPARPVVHYIHAWKGREGGAARIVTYTETSGTDGGTWGSVADERDLKAKVAWRNLDGIPLEDSKDTVSIPAGPLQGEWTIACEGRPPIKVNFPRFADYPFTGKPYRGRVAKMGVPRGLHENWRIRLKESLGDDDKPDVAGHYIRLKWPCGTACVGVALMDATSGRVIMLPSLSDWGDVGDDFEPIAGRIGSRLVVLSGARNERGIIGRHFYVLENGRLKHLRSVEVERSFPQRLE